MKTHFFSKITTIALLLVLCSAPASAFLLKSQREKLGEAKEKEIPVKTLSVQLKEDQLPENLSESALRLPQTGEYKGIFTRQVTMYGDRPDTSVVFSLGTKALDTEGNPFLGVISPAQKKMPSDLPEPTITNATLLSVIEVSADAPVSFDPPASIRFVLPEKQEGNSSATAYFYNSEASTYEELSVSISDDGKGIIAPLAQNGLYVFYDREGKIVEAVPEETPDSADESTEETVEEKNTTPAEIIPEASFLDMEEHWARPFVARAISVGIFDGSKPFFRPEEGATRAELVKMISAQKFSESEISECPRLFPSPFVPVFFTDVAQGEWYAPFVCVSARAKMISGREDGSFGPNDFLTRAEAVMLLVSVSSTLSPKENPTTSPFVDVPLDAWYAPAVISAANAGIVSGQPAPKVPVVISAERLSLGEQSPEVLKLKKILRELGFFTGEMTDELDFSVKEAVFQFQKSRGILSDRNDPSAGSVGPNTISTINALGISVPETESEGQNFFRPAAPVTRAELAKLTVEILGTEKNTTLSQ